MSEEKSYTTEDLLLFIDKLRRENKQLKAELEMYENGVYYSSENDKLKEVIEEVSKIVENNFLESTLETFVCLKTTEYKNLKKILDKAKEK